MFPEASGGPEVLLCRFPDVPAAEAVRVATALRAGGRRVEIYPDAPGLGKQLGYGGTIGARFAAILGASELAAGTIALKHLGSGEQRAVALGAAAAALAAWV
jgi:histidyl-tRNA synthetase